MVEEVVANEQDTLEWLLFRARRKFVPIRHAFVHKTDEGGGGGPLVPFVRRPETLDLYILLLAAAVKTPFMVPWPAAVWSRALGRGTSAGAQLWVSKSLRWLEDQSLIKRHGKGRGRRIEIRREDGSGGDYTRPKGSKTDKGEWFLSLPHEYFLDGWHKQLTGPGKAVLLIAYTRQPEFTLPERQAASWYGLSRSTIAAGIDELQDLGLLATRPVRKKAPQLIRGYTIEPHYALTGPFKRPRRQGLPEKEGLVAI